MKVGELPTDLEQYARVDAAERVKAKYSNKIQEDAWRQQGGKKRSHTQRHHNKNKTICKRRR